MKALVTGGLGFIGARMCQYLIERNYKVIVIDNAKDGTLKRKINHPNITYYLTDICHYNLTRHIYDGVDYVFHFAAESRVPGCEANPSAGLTTNYIGTAVVLQCAHEAGVKYVVNSSSSAVYGDTRFNVNPRLQSTMDVPKPIGYYGLSKLNAEDLCKYYYMVKNMNVTSLRYFNVYGPGEDVSGQYAQAVAIFLHQYEMNQPITIFGDGKQTRDFIHVDDVIQANMDCINNPSCQGLALNVGTGKSHSILELAKLLEPDVSKIKFQPKRKGDALHTCADMDFSHSVNISKANNSVIDYMLKQKKMIDEFPLTLKNQVKTFAKQNP